MFRFHLLAYLDPSTSSTVFQLTVASVLSTMAAARFHWAKLKNVFGRWTSNPRRKAKRSKQA